MKKKTYDLHDIYNNSKKIEDTLNLAINEAIEKKIKTIEIIPGKGSGQLKKRFYVF